MSDPDKISRQGHEKLIEQQNMWLNYLHKDIANKVQVISDCLY